MRLIYKIFIKDVFLYFEWLSSIYSKLMMLTSEIRCLRLMEQLHIFQTFYIFILPLKNPYNKFPGLCCHSLRGKK